MEPPSSAAISGLTTSLYIFASFILVGLNAFFVASEFAIVKVRRTRLEELAGQGIASARVSILCVDQLDEYLSATQLGITLVSLALGWIGEESFHNALLLIFPALASEGAHVFAAAISFFAITMLHVVLGELVPKSMAIQRAEQITLAVAKPLQFFYRAARPLIHFFTEIANWVLRRIGYGDAEEPPVSEDELKIMMKESHEEGVITESEAQIIHKAFEFSDRRAGDIMIPASNVHYLSLQKSYADNMATTRKRMHTRFPLTNNGLDSVLGIVHVKDFLHHPEEANHSFQAVVRPALFIEPGLTQDKLMKLFKAKRAHMAIVQDPKTKHTLGIVTMEDILEGLVGEILDEHGN